MGCDRGRTSWEVGGTIFWRGDFHRGTVQRNVRGELPWICVRIPVQDYKSLCAAVVICAVRVNTQTHTDRQLLAELKTSDQKLMKASIWEYVLWWTLKVIRFRWNLTSTFWPWELFWYFRSAEHLVCIREISTRHAANVLRASPLSQGCMQPTLWELKLIAARSFLLPYRTHFNINQSINQS